MEDTSEIQQIEQLMYKQLQSSLHNGHAQIFTLIKKAAKLVVGDEIVADELINFKPILRSTRLICCFPLHCLYIMVFNFYSEAIHSSDVFIS